MEKKIHKPLTIVFLFMVFLGLTAIANASTESQALVTEGRLLLFNGGDATYSGIIAANDKFNAAVAADATDQVANLFYAATRMLASALDQGNSPDFSTLATLGDLFGAIGAVRNNVDLVDEEAPFNDPPSLNDEYDPPDTLPTGTELQAYLAGPFIDLLDLAIGNLDTIDNTIDIVLTVAEIGDEAIEVDYGDVLLMKSMLYTLKAFAFIFKAYDFNMDLREIIVLANADFLQLQRDLLDKYAGLFSLLGDGAASLGSARQALDLGIERYRDGFNFITGETDPQENDLFYFESSEDVSDANSLLTQLTELQNSIDTTSPRPAVFKTTEETWTLTDGNNSVRMMIEKDLNGNFVDGHAWGLDGCDFLFCSGRVEEFTVSGSDVTIELESNHWCGSVQYTLTGTAVFQGDQLTGIDPGNYSWTDCESNPRNGTFTGTRDSAETETDTIDFNRVFGNSAPPLDIRAVLPQFNPRNEPKPGTFPPTDDSSPVLNGILPDIQTNDDLTREFELQPSKKFNIPQATITIDGGFTDWTQDLLVFTDIAGDEDEEANFQGMDLKDFYLAQDANFYYFRMTFYDGLGVVSDGATPGYHFMARRFYDGSMAGDRICGVNPADLSVEVFEESGGFQANYSAAQFGYAAAGTDSIEWKVPKADMGTLAGKFVNVWTNMMSHTMMNEASDYNQTNIKLDTASLSGTVTCADHDGTGKIFIWAFDGPSFNTNVLGKTYIDSPGNFSIDGLPIGANVYLFARWDSDNNGVKNLGDYLGMNPTAYLVQSGGTTGASVTADTELNIGHIVNKGLQWLRDNQNQDGSWGSDSETGNVLGATEFAALAFLNNGVDGTDQTVADALDYITGKVQTDGAISDSNSWVQNYTTAIGILTLVAADKYNDPKQYTDVISNAVKYLIGIQNTEDNINNYNNSDLSYGGWGYNQPWPNERGQYWADMSNSQWDALALFEAKNVVNETIVTKAQIETAVTRSLIFFQRCQHRPATNDLSWAHDKTNDSYHAYPVSTGLSDSTGFACARAPS